MRHSGRSSPGSSIAVENAEIAVRRAEQTHIAGCAYRALCCVAQVLFALNGRYLINEKGAVAEAATCPITIEGLVDAPIRYVGTTSGASVVKC